MFVDESKNHLVQQDRLQRLCSSLQLWMQRKVIRLPVPHNMIRLLTLCVRRYSSEEPPAPSDFRLLRRSTLCVLPAIPEHGSVRAYYVPSRCYVAS